jgi:hypothetical protein
VVLSGGVHEFDLGPATLNRVTTDKRSYPNTTDAVEARLDVYSPSGGAAQVVLTPDSGPVTSQPVSLNGGCETLTVLLDGPIPAGKRQLTAALEMGGYTAPAVTEFDYGVSLPDLWPGAPWVAGSGELTRTVTALVSNRGRSASLPSTARFFAGGSQVGTAAVPALAAGEQVPVSFVWNIQGQGGKHELSVTVDSSGEYDEGNNGAATQITLPRLSTDLAAAPPTIGAGGVVAFALGLQNLQPAALPVTATLAVRSPWGELVHSQSWSLTLGGGQALELDSEWQSGAGATPGVYAVLYEARDAYGEQHLGNTSFAVLPCPGLTSLSLSGPPVTSVGVDTAFTASVAPASALLPVTYTWTTVGQPPLNQTGGLSNTVQLSWTITGTQSITATATNACGPSVQAVQTVTVESTPSICPYPLLDASIGGPGSGYPDQVYTFTAVITPANATAPVTYTWQPEPGSGQSTASASYQWAVEGSYSLTLKAGNCGGEASDTWYIDIEAKLPTVYLPVVLRSQP